MRIQVRCINKTNRTSIHERISHVGNGISRWALDDAIAWLERPGNSFFVQPVGPNGRKYLRTVADTTTVNNLLSLPECGE